MSTKTIDWSVAVSHANGPREKEIVYQFSNGRTFKEPFDPSGTGIYEQTEEVPPQDE